MKPVREIYEAIQVILNWEYVVERATALSDVSYIEFGFVGYDQCLHLYIVEVWFYNYNHHELDSGIINISNERINEILSRSDFEECYQIAKQSEAYVA